jgi:beta-glucosidase
LNEPWVVTDGGYLHGILAPGHRSAFEAPLASHNLMRAHGASVQVYRGLNLRSPIGLVVNIEPKYAASQDPADLAAVKRAEGYMNRQYLQPALQGSYPEELKDVFGEAWPDFPSEDFELIKQKLDFLGVNYYTRSVTKNDPSFWPVRASGVRQKHHTHTETGWEVFPQGLTDTLLWVKNNYGNPPLYITENGAAFFDPPQVEGPILEDPLRVDYLRKHLRAVHEAIQQGADIRGYFVWSLFDNLEWAYGFSKRFGIVHVNYATLARTPKASARFYSKVIETNGAALFD